MVFAGLEPSTPTVQHDFRTVEHERVPTGLRHVALTGEPLLLLKRAPEQTNRPCCQR